MKKIKIKLLFLFIVFEISCHKFEENTLLLKNVPFQFNGKTWYTRKIEKNGINILVKDIVSIPFSKKSYEESFHVKGKNLRVRFFEKDITQDTFFNKYCNNSWWEIIKFNSAILKVRLKRNNDIYIMYMQDRK